MPSDIIQWFPGHMAATKRLIRENLSAVDVIFELTDARIPLSSKNPQLEELVQTKPVILIMNKAGLADPVMSDRWAAKYRKTKAKVVCIDCMTRSGIKHLSEATNEVLAEKLERNRQKNIQKPMKAMVVGIPNVGKSSLINVLCGQKKAKVENRPGVTLTKQWVKTSIGLDLLDMPGVLWPKFSDRTIGENLSITGAIKDAVVLTEEIAPELCERLKTLYPHLLKERYKLTDEDLKLDKYQLTERIGRKRGMLMGGGEVDMQRCANMLLEEYRSGKIGRITLEVPTEE